MSRARPPRLLPPLLLALLLAACVDTDALDEMPPTDSPEAVRTWLLDERHRSWESAHASVVQASASPGGVRLFYNQLLADSLAAGQARHPVGAAAVREIYGLDHQTLVGYALMVKVDDDDLARDWFFYELFDPAVNTEAMVAEPGASSCTGCHGDAPDFVHAGPLAP